MAPCRPTAMLEKTIMVSVMYCLLVFEISCVMLYQCISVEISYRCVVNVCGPDAGEKEEEDVCEIVNRYDKEQYDVG